MKITIEIETTEVYSDKYHLNDLLEMVLEEATGGHFLGLGEYKGVVKDYIGAIPKKKECCSFVVKVLNIEVKRSKLCGQSVLSAK
jgi:hypothetical protein